MPFKCVAHVEDSVIGKKIARLDILNTTKIINLSIKKLAEEDKIEIICRQHLMLDMEDKNIETTILLKRIWVFQITEKIEVEAETDIMINPITESLSKFPKRIENFQAIQVNK